MKLEWVGENYLVVLGVILSGTSVFALVVMLTQMNNPEFTFRDRLVHFIVLSGWSVFLVPLVLLGFWAMSLWVFLVMIIEGLWPSIGDWEWILFFRRKEWGKIFWLG